MKRILLLLIVIATTVFMVIPVEASPILYEYLNTGGDANSIDIFGANVVAQQFTVTTSHTVTSIKLELLCVLAPPTVKVSLYNAAAGVPTTEITSVTYAGTVLADSYTMTTFDIPDTSLLPSTQYAIVVSSPNGNATNYIRWHQDSGGGLGSAVGLHSHDTGISWTSDTPADYLFEVYGEVVFQVKDANIFQDYLVDGDWLLVVETVNDYPGYADITDPEQYFNVQLRNVAGTVVLAATTLKSYGDTPCSIYLSPSTVSALTYGSAYIVRMVGNFTGTPYVEYTLSNTIDNDDWQGSDLRALDSWCLKTAKSMNTYDGNTNSHPYTSKSSSGELLSTEGGSGFIAGIPNIMEVRPDLFEKVIRKPIYDYGVATNTFDNETSWDIEVGSVIASDAASLGAILGITAKQFLSMGLWIIYIFAMLFIFVNKAGAETMFVAVICVPLLLIGAYFRIIEIQVLLVTAAMLALLFTWKMIMSR